MSNIWERFESIAKPEDVMEAKSQFETTKPGVYKMLLESIEPSENRNGLPMLKAKFRHTEDNKLTFLNLNLQVLNQQWLTDKNIAEAITLVSGILGEQIEFTGMTDFANLLMEIPIGSEHLIEVSYEARDTAQSYPKLTVVEPSLDVEDLDMDSEESEDDSIPF